jgi:hypothetical protein
MRKQNGAQASRLHYGPQASGLPAGLKQALIFPGFLLILLLFSVTVTAHEKHGQTKPVQSAPVKQTEPVAPTTTAPAEHLEEEEEGEMPGLRKHC